MHEAEEGGWVADGPPRHPWATLASACVRAADE